MNIVNKLNVNERYQLNLAYNLNLGDPEGYQGWWEGHRKSQDTPV
jgi:hypothetical protein